MDKHKLAAVYAQLALGYQTPLTLKVLQSYKSLDAFSRAVFQKKAEQPFLTAKHLQQMYETKLEDAQKIVEDCERLGIGIAAIGDAQYPQPLLQLYAPPAVVYTKGALPDFDKTLCVTVVGSRKAPQQGKDNAFWLGKALTLAGACVISGLAQGIDASAQAGALAAGGKTVAVLGNGLDIAYPVENAALQELVAQNGALISEYPPGVKPLPYHFPQRNRLMAALGRAVAVVQAREKSGAMITVNLALELGRDVFCMPGDVNQDSCKGNLTLLREGATVFGSAADILNEYLSEFSDTIEIARADIPFQEGASAWRPQQAQTDEKPLEQNRPLPAQKPQTAQAHVAGAACSPNARAVLKVLGEQPMHFDEIVNNTSLPAFQVLRALTELQIGGYIKTYAGRRFSL